MITNGTRVKEGERTYQLRLFSDRDGNGKLNGKERNGFCGASLIQDYDSIYGAWVLTAAHCLRMGSGVWPPDYGLYYVGGGSVDMKKLEMKRITLDKNHVIIHPKWTGASMSASNIDHGIHYTNSNFPLNKYLLSLKYLYQSHSFTDIALIKLDAPFKTIGVRDVVPLNFEIPNEELIGRMATISGWGAYLGGASGKQHRYLQETTLEISLNGLPKDTVLGLDNTDGKSACGGDSGGNCVHNSLALNSNNRCIFLLLISTSFIRSLGPATIRKYGKYDYQVGIASKLPFSKYDCGNSDDFSMYQSVYPYRDWIYDTIKNTFEKIPTF